MRCETSDRGEEPAATLRELSAVRLTGARGDTVHVRLDERTG
jgi:hypothetical protein